MNVKAEHEWGEIYFALMQDAKFVAYEEASQRTIALGESGLANYGTSKPVQHIDLLPKAATLLGAGIIRNFTADSVDVKYDSYTCRKERGYDRPDSQEEIEFLTTEIRKTLLEWRKNLDDGVK